MRTRALTAVLTAVVAALLMTGCGADTTAESPAGSTPPSSAQQQADDHNQADIAFAQGMIPHHAQAIVMAQAAVQHAQSSQVKDLARRIEHAQAPEIATMTAWLNTWNAPLPPTQAGAMNHGGMDQGGMGGRAPMPGMMDSRQMQQLRQVSGAAFDQMFLQMMIRHHEGAITMARTELVQGRNPAAKQLAQRLIDTQQAEIQEMKTLLSQG